MRSDAKLTVRFSVVEQNIERIQHIALAVSDPASPVYGDFPTQQQIDDIVAPKPEDVAAVTDWLATYQRAIPAGDRFEVSTAKEVVTLRTTFAHAGTLLSTKFHHVRNAGTQQRTHRAGDVRVPTAVGNVLQAVYGVHGLPAPPKQPLRSNKAVGDAPEQAPVTPAVLTSHYTVDKGGVKPTGSTANRQAVAEFQGQAMSKTDLSQFFKKYVPKAQKGDDTVFKPVQTLQSILQPWHALMLIPQKS